MGGATTEPKLKSNLVEYEPLTGKTLDCQKAVYVLFSWDVCRVQENMRR